MTISNDAGGRARVETLPRPQRGTTRCQLTIPLGHPLCRLLEIERGTVFEVEQRRTYEAGPGLTKVCLIEPATGARRAADQNLQAVDDHQPALMCDGLYLGRGAAPARPESGTTQRNNKPEAMAVVAGRT